MEDVRTCHLAVVLKATSNRSVHDVHIMFYNGYYTDLTMYANVWFYLVMHWCSNYDRMSVFIECHEGITCAKIIVRSLNEEQTTLKVLLKLDW